MPDLALEDFALHYEVAGSGHRRFCWQGSLGTVQAGPRYCSCSRHISPSYALTIAALGEHAGQSAYIPTVRPSDITCPAIVPDAEDDLVTPEAEARERFSAMQDVRQFTLSASGHAIHWDAVDEVAVHSKQFIGAQRSEGKP